MDFAQGADKDNKKILLEKAMNLLPQNEINVLWQKYQNDLPKINTSMLMDKKENANESLKEQQEEKNNSDIITNDEPKLFTNNQENATFEIDSNDSQENGNNIPEETNKKRGIEKPKKTAQIFSEFMKVPEEENNMNADNLKQDKEKIQENNSCKPQKPEDKNDDLTNDLFLEKIKKILMDHKKEKMENEKQLTTDENEDILEIKEENNENKNKNYFIGKKRKDAKNYLENDSESENDNKSKHSLFVPDNENDESESEEESIKKIRNLTNFYNKRSNPENSNIRRRTVEMKLEKQKEEINSRYDEKDDLLDILENNGILYILNCLTKITLNRNIKAEKKLDDMINRLGLLKTWLLIFQNYLENKSKKQNRNINKNFPNYFEKENKSNINNSSFLSNGETQTQPEEKISKINNINKRINDLSFKKEENLKSEQKRFNPNGFSLSLHYHKDKDGKIYKYAKHHYLGKEICVFYCCDKDCNSTANYYLKTSRFELINGHTKKYEDHYYIIKPDKDYKIMEDFKKKNFREAQMFKKPEGPKIVQWYD